MLNEMDTTIILQQRPCDRKTKPCASDVAEKGLTMEYFV